MGFVARSTRQAFIGEVWSRNMRVLSVIEMVSIVKKRDVAMDVATVIL
jgi:hypothetical protein